MKPLERLFGPKKPEGDVERWRKRAKVFEQFWNKLPLEVQNYIEYTGSPYEVEHAVGSLEALFLGEKPMVFGISTLDAIPEDTLKQFGLERQNSYIFNPRIIEQLVKNNPGVFTDFDCSSARAVITDLDNRKITTADTARGILLGYPRDSSWAIETIRSANIHQYLQFLISTLPEQSTERQTLQDGPGYGDETSPEQRRQFFNTFMGLITERQKELSLTDEHIELIRVGVQLFQERRLVTVYGVRWVDFGNSEESRQIQKRLRAAFEQSGILDILHPTPEAIRK